MYSARLSAHTGTAGELRNALRSRGLTIAYQPIIDLRTGTIAAMEALARWTTPSGTTVSPAEFIPIAEESGLIGELGSQVLAMALRDAATWQRVRPTGLRVNVSAQEIRTPGFYDDVMRKIRRAGLAPSLLGLEITESVLVSQEPTTLATLSRLRDAGVSLLLDDYGSGYSDAAHLQRFPVVTMLKIDRTFLGDPLPPGQLPAPPQDGGEVMEAVVALARDFSMKVCAEGVESAAQHTKVLALGCDQAQGYYFARPTTPASVLAMLQAWAPFLPVERMGPAPV